MARGPSYTRAKGTEPTRARRAAPRPRMRARPTAGAAPRRAAVAVRATSDNGNFAFAEGAKVKVKEAVKVYHVPKVDELQLQVRDMRFAPAKHEGGAPLTWTRGEAGPAARTWP